MDFKPKYTIVKKENLPHTVIELRDDGIIQFFYGDYVMYNTKISQEVENSVMAITKGQVFMSLRIAGNQSGMDLKVMRYLSRGRGCLFTLADAFVIKSFFQRILARIYMSFSKPYVPTKFFKKIKDAEAWLKTLNVQELKQIHKLNLERV